MIVSENSSFLNMELPKRGTSMAPMVTRTAAPDFLLDSRVRGQSRMREDGVLLKPAEFKAWRSKLD